ncbi:MAG TPA: SAF domain-containing protein, partial [Solirubrobacteraceae bacterium]
AGREAALRRQLGPTVPVVVVRVPLAAGQRIARAALALRHVPARYVPAGAVGDPALVVGRRAAVAVAPGADLDPALLRVPGDQKVSAGPRLGPGERALDVLAVADAEAMPAGARVDVLVTYEGRAGGPAATRMVLNDAEVLQARPAGAAPGPDASAGLPRVLASLRVGVRQAVALTAAVSAAREVRLLPRPTG